MKKVYGVARACLIVLIIIIYVVVACFCETIIKIDRTKLNGNDCSKTYYQNRRFPSKFRKNEQRDDDFYCALVLCTQLEINDVCVSL